MRKVTLDELRQIAEEQREAVWAEARSVGREPKVYLHWTAGHYFQKFDDYHINITANGDIWLATDDLSEVLAHTWRRNTGSIGVTLCCCAGATSADLGDEPPTPQQIECMAQVIATLCNALWLTIDRERVLTHGEAADNADGCWCHEEYGCLSTVERWDLQYLGTEESPVYLKTYDDERTGGNILRGKANWYASEWAD
ncbi:hypothetical protein SELR_pSRC400520 (plasmid) [Selenomonas ruminantium subsp. lactilytica TAM6421]|uniref:N-acetylmuramoyl-L-alanine amidase domain-containing protein n=1 Tax=Selenomonas ruminantium subsp. lactilytica (strain NBRC 103574 / TAM6421) TaxID=927704 RepID=I0GVB6_SELRL|nr:N-acetylmuramoyl-L-alanine amidase [Selenomonas ruminantium]BAL84703.1 hypothetical protein SELR_pSRC400520 [Selenomonas ruminantium subsp. lactilytica TAM6421]